LWFEQRLLFALKDALPTSLAALMAERNFITGRGS
jgi:hypothetical protein